MRMKSKLDKSLDHFKHGSRTRCQSQFYMKVASWNPIMSQATCPSMIRLVAIVLLFFFCALLLLKSSDLKITKKLYVAIFLMQIVLLRVFVWLCGCLTLCRLLFSEKWPYVLKQTCSFQLQVCLSINLL